MSRRRSRMLRCPASMFMASNSPRDGASAITLASPYTCSQVTLRGSWSSGSDCIWRWMNCIISLFAELLFRMRSTTCASTRPTTSEPSLSRPKSMAPRQAAKNSSAVMCSRRSRSVSAYEKKYPWQYPPRPGTRAPSSPASVCQYSLSVSNSGWTSAPQASASQTRQPAEWSRRSRQPVHCSSRSGVGSMTTCGPYTRPSR
mmetsp:Transcript_1261/g.2995  ORF Transcript_1261/g.2995 Transcript_1261/m.2995 type:complete len:201 (+) Transcript_1261:139-741(+)